jgi:tmRNA-binding protein
MLVGYSGAAKVPTERRENQEAARERKVRLATEALLRISAEKHRQAAWGQVCVKLFWEQGCLKMVEITDTTTIKDLPAGEAMR